MTTQSDPNVQSIYFIIFVQIICTVMLYIFKFAKAMKSEDNEIVLVQLSFWRILVKIDAAFIIAQVTFDKLISHNFTKCTGLRHNCPQVGA